MTTPDVSAWDWFAAEREKCERFFRAMQRKHRMGEDGREALESECYHRLPEIVAAYDPRKGAELSTHVFASWKWVCHKLLRNSSAGRWGLIHSNVDAARKRRARPMEAAANHRSGAQSPPQEASARDEVQSALSRVDAFSRALIHMRFDCELSYAEIGSALGVSHVRASEMVAVALRECRRAAAAGSAGASDECLDLIAELRRELR